MNYLNNIIRGFVLSLFFVLNAGTAFAGGGDLPPVAVTKTCPATAKPGETITCDVKLSNPTKEDYWEVELSEVVPGNLTFINEGLDASCKVKGGRPVCSFSPLKKYDSKTFWFKFRVSDNAACNSVITNQVDVNAKDAETNWAKAMITVKCDDGDKPVCKDGKDNDGDGWIDNDDSCCIKTNGQSETCDNQKPQCSDGIDNDGDGWKDLDDSGCTDANDNDESNQPTGGNGLVTSISGTTTGRVGDMIFVDLTVTNKTGENLWNVTSDFNYGNGIRVWTIPAGCKANGANGFRCTIADLVKGGSKTYKTKIKIDQCIQGNYGDFSANATKPRLYTSNVSVLTLNVTGCNNDKPQCSDGKDNDGDGWVDLDDSCCVSATHNAEACTPGKPKITKTGPATVKPGDTATYIVTVTNTGTTKLTGLGAGDHFPAPYNTLFTYLPGQSSPECTQYVQDGLTVYGCGFFNLNAGESKQFTFTYKVPHTAPCDVQVVDQADVSVPGGAGDWAKFMTQIKCEAKPQCSDGKDNDGDGWIDLDDSGCDGPNDDDETNKPECQDGKDNDKDGWIDHDDSCCVQTGGKSESCTAPDKPQCSDGKDNDGDGKIDHPADPGCDSPTDNDETNKPQCSDGKDNDGDGWVDLDDSGCEGPHDDDETDKPQCKDGKDNDGDGKIDFPADPGCDSPTDNDEKDKPQCSDGKDNDGDGKIDHPADPGCDSPADNDETNKKPQCSDGKDNDGDGWIDLDDSGCEGPDDDNESDDPNGKLKITKTGPSEIHPDKLVSYTVTVVNDSKKVFKNTHVGDIVPAGLTFVPESSTAGCALQGGTVICEKYTHGANQTKVYTLSFRVAAKAACDSVIMNQADVHTTDGPSDWSKVQSTVKCENKVSPVIPISECIYDLGNGSFRAYFGYENNGKEVITVQAGTDTTEEINAFTPGASNRGQVSVFELGRKKAVFSVDFNGESLTWKVQPKDSDLKSVTVTKHTQACKPVKPIAECRDRKQSKYLTFFGYQNDNQFEVKLSIPSENKFVPAPEDRAQPDKFFPGRVANAFSVNSDSDLTWKLATESTVSNSSLPACTSNGVPTCKPVTPTVAQCGGSQTRIALSGSQAVDNDPLTYKWSSDCPGSSFSDPTAQNPDLIINTSDGVAKTCGVWLVVDDGSNPPVTCDQTVKVEACNKDCNGEANGDAEVDLCGVCGGNNACVDCKGVPNGGAKFDQCGVCGGNNSCADCAGVPGGNAKLDQCGVCKGDGRSCLDCAQNDQNDKKLTLDIGVNQQRLLILKLTTRLQNASNNDKKFNKVITDALNRSELLYQNSWRTVWTQLPGTTVNCSNSTLCSQSDLSAAISSYDSDSIELRDIALNLLRQIGTTRGKNDKKQKTNDKKYTQQANQLYSANAAVLASYPRFTSTCQ